jgi:oxaloacetate decarboxylase alpha subunit
VEAARNGAEPIATAAHPVASMLNRVAGEVLCEALDGLDLPHGVDLDQAWRVSRAIDEHITSHMPALPVPPRITLRTAFNRVPVGVVTELDIRLRHWGAADRLDEVLAELAQVRQDCGMPPLAQPIGGIVAGQAVRHVLSAQRWADASDEMRALLSGGYGTPPLPIAEPARALVEGTTVEPPEVPDLEALRERTDASSEEDLLLVALFGSDAERLLDTLRNRGERTTERSEAMDADQSERIEELVRLVESSDVAELTLEDGAVRITVRKQDERPAPAAVPAAVDPGAAENGQAAEVPSVSTLFKIESPMVGTFYRSPAPNVDAFVQEGDRVEVGQTLCILEAMKLFNELKSDHSGVIRRILVGNAEPVEFGQPLFELEPA